MANLIYSVLPTPPRKIIYVLPDKPLKECIDLMANMDIGAVVVITEDNRLVGMVTERDIVRSCLHQCVDLNTAKVSDVVFKDVSILSPNDTIEKAMQVITQTKRRYVLIKDHDEFIAILSIGDLLLSLLDDKSRVINHLEQYISS